MTCFGYTLGYAARGLSLGVMLLLGSVPAANALTLTLSSTSTPSGTGEVEFDPTDPAGGGTGSFSFIPSGLANFAVDTSDGVGDSVGLQGSISGVFDIGIISNPITGVETAPVSGLGTLSISDGVSEFFTADVTFENLATIGTGGVIHTTGTANLTSLMYTGGNADLTALAAAPAGTQTVTFQFAFPTSITELTSGSSKTTTNFSSTISTVPIPAAAWLFGSALFGITMLGRRKKAAQSR